MKAWHLAALLISGAAIACDAVSDLFSMTLEGRVEDSEGNPVEGAEVKAFLFSDNVRAFSKSEDEFPTSAEAILKYRVRVDLPQLLKTGTAADKVLTNADGVYRIEGLLTNGVIATAGKKGYSTYVRGMNVDDGTVSINSALAPQQSEEGAGIMVAADFVIAGPGRGDNDPPPDDEDDEAKEDIVPPANSAWESFTIEDADGNVLADASTADATLDWPAAKLVRIKGRHSNVMLDKAFLRVQHGASTCGADAPNTKVDVVHLALANGEISSNDGNWHTWYLDEGHNVLQLDLDVDLDDGTESHVVSSAEECAKPKSAMTATLTWSTPGVDTDLYVWNDGEIPEETYWGTYSPDGVQGKSSYGLVAVGDYQGNGPEVFTLDPGQHGKYSMKAQFYCGPEDPVTNVHLRVQRWYGGEWKDESFSADGQQEGFVDFGTFEVDELN